MSATFGRLDTAPQIENYQNTEYFHRAAAQHYRVVQRDGHTYQQRFELDAAGHPVRQFELEATHVIGSGRHARTYLHLSPAGELIELPLSWYTQEHRWALSPGYDQPNNAGFTRVADGGCLFCHMANPQGHAGSFGIRDLWSADTLPSGIDCQRCHGPGAAHVELASRGVTGAALKSAIVNPSRLPRERGLDVCLQCHLESTSSNLPHALRRFGRDVFSFRPGESLSNYILQFDHPPEASRKDKFEVNSAGYRLMQSPCFLKSAGKLTCTTCHDPHSTERVSSKTCLTCHSPHAESNRIECISCHMPQRRTEDAVHVVITDHRIQVPAQNADYLRPRAELVQPYHGNLQFLQPYPLTPAERSLYLGLALTVDGANLPKGISLLHAQISAEPKPPVEAVVGLARALAASGRTSEAAAQCESALHLHPELSAVRAECAKVLEQLKKPDAALAEYRKALASDSQLPAAAFGIARLTSDAAEAARMYRVAAQSLPLRADALSDLGNLLTKPETLPEAKQTLEEAIALNPQLASAENNLARVSALQSDLPAALEHAKRALALDERLTEARFNYAQLLQATGRDKEAIAEYNKLLRQQPGSVLAHLALGNALGDQGDFPAAIREFEQVLRLEPNNPEARQKLAMAKQLLGQSQQR